MRALRILLTSVPLALVSASSGGVAAGLVLPEDLGVSDFRIVRAFPEIEPSRPVQLLMAPSDDRYLFVVERPGSLLRVDIANPAASVRILGLEEAVADFSIERGFMSAAFHPEFPTHPYLFLYYTVMDDTSQGEGGYMRLSRVTMDPADMTVDLATEVIYIHQYDPFGEHQGGTICFGPEDGYLYLGIGDGGKGIGARENTQQIDQDFFGAVIRIDVDQRPGNLLPNDHPASHGNYRIPADNPYIGATMFNGKAVDPASVRTEFYAVGFRNPFRMNFFPATGELWVGDVGWASWEELNRVEAGKNYGWPYYEGAFETSPTLRDDLPEGVSFEPPVWAYDGAVGDTIVVGRPYYGRAFPELYGKLLVQEFGRGTLFSFSPQSPDEDPAVVAYHRIGITDTITDPRDGGILFATHNRQIIEKLERMPDTGGQPPRWLSETSAFDPSRFPELEPAPGVMPYEINVPFWSDHAIKSRFFALPEGEAIGYSTDGNWTFPAGSVWIKHFEVESARGDPSSRRPLETRFIVKTHAGAYGITYRWNEERSDAELVSAEGLAEELSFIDEDGQQQTQRWDFPSQGNCLACHTSSGGFALGFSTPQLNRFGSGSWGALNQIDAMADAGHFGHAPNIPGARPSMAPAWDESASLTHRVKSYLQANCAQCHSPDGNALGFWDARLATRTRDAGLLYGPVERGSDSNNDHIVTPGSPEQSVLFHRISRHEGRMPPIGSLEPDEVAIALFKRWIEEEAASLQNYHSWADLHFPGDPAASQSDADPDKDELTNFEEFVLRTDPNESSSKWEVEARRDVDTLVLRYRNPANRGAVVERWLGGPSADWQSVATVDGEQSIPYPAEAQEVEARLLIEGDEAGLYRVRVVEP